MGHGTLPKLNHTDPALRAAMVDGPDSVVARWLRPPFDLDGWRVDVANMTGRLGATDVNHDVARAVRRTAEAERPDAFVIGEHNHDASTDVDGDGWHGTMNYSGFSWPVWSWLRDPASPARAFGRPVPVPRRPGAQRAAEPARVAGPLRLARDGRVLEHPRLPRQRPDPHRHRLRRGAPGRGRAAVHPARGADAVRRRRDRAGGRARRGLPPAVPLAPPGGLGRRDAGDVRRAGAAARTSTRRCVAAGCAGRTSTTTPWCSSASTRPGSVLVAATAAPASAPADRRCRAGAARASATGTLLLTHRQRRRDLVASDDRQRCHVALAPAHPERACRCRPRLRRHSSLEAWRCASWRTARTRLCWDCRGRRPWRSGPSTSCRSPADSRATSCGSSGSARTPTRSRRPSRRSRSASTGCCATSSGSGCPRSSPRAS